TGQPIEARGSRSVEQLSAFRERLDTLGNHRWSIVAGGLVLSVLLIAAAARGMPGVMLLTGAIAPSGLVELGILAATSAALALLTDRLLPWPRSIALPAAVTVGAHVVALVFGSELI